MRIKGFDFLADVWIFFDFLWKLGFFKASPTAQGGQISTMLRLKTAAQSRVEKSDFKKFQVSTMRIGKTGVFLVSMCKTGALRAFESFCIWQSPGIPFRFALTIVLSPGFCRIETINYFFGCWEYSTIASGSCLALIPEVDRFQRIWKQYVVIPTRYTQEQTQNLV